MKDWLYHGLTGNSASAEQTGLTRGIVAAALMEVVFLVVRTIPMGQDMRVDVLAHTGAIIVLLSFVLYAYLDKWLKSKGLR